MTTITREQAKDLRNAFECWQQDYDPTADKEQYEMFGLGVVAMDVLLASLDAGSNSNPAHGPLSDYRLHRIREILGKAATQRDGGNIGYAMSDAVKAIDELLAGRKAEPVGEVVLGEYDDSGCHPDARVVCIAADGQADWGNFKDGTRLYATTPAPVTIDERAAFNAWNNEDNLPIAGVGAKNAAWLAWQARARLGSPTAPVVPATLPCSVELKPGLIIGKGCKTETLLTALKRRADYYAEIDAMTAEERAEHDANIEAFKAMLPPPAPAVPTFDEWLEIRGNKPLGWVKDAMRESYDACRAAMLNGGKS